MPTGIATARARVSAAAASETVLPSRSRIRVDTGSRYVRDQPKSPCAARSSHFTYLTCGGSSSP